MKTKTGRSRILLLFWVITLLAALHHFSSDPVLAVSASDKGSVVRLPEDTYRVEDSFVYEVQTGDDLHWLAARFYGNPRNWVKIFEANRAGIRNPNHLRVGQKLTIPSNIRAQ